MKSKKIQEDSLALMIKSANERIRTIERTRTEIIENYSIKIEKENGYLAWGMPERFVLIEENKEL